MANERFKVLFDHMDVVLRSHPELRLDKLEGEMIQDEEIRRLMEIIRDTTPTPKPLLYSSS